MYNELYDIFDAAINTIVEKYNVSWTEIFNDERMIEVEKIIMETLDWDFEELEHNEDYLLWYGDTAYIAPEPNYTR